MTGESGIGKEKIKELENQFLNEGKSLERALEKILPRPKTKPIDNAWRYLISQGMITTSEPQVTRSYIPIVKPYREKWTDDTIKNWIISICLYYNTKELEIRGFLQEFVRKYIPNYFRKIGETSLEDVARINIKYGNTEDKIERFLTFLSVDVVKLASENKLLKLKECKVGKETGYYYSCVEENFGEYSEDLNLIP